MIREKKIVASQKMGDKNACFFWRTLEHPGWLLFLCMEHDMVIVCF